MLQMDHPNPDINNDIQTVGRISAVPIILEVICRITGLGFAAVARVTPEKWVALSVLDKLQFGLIPGGELVVDSTICHEIRQSGEGVIIDHVAQDDYYCNHHTPIQYGLQSYISIPIKRSNGSFYGTLCAIDPSPALLTVPEIKELFEVYAELISMHLDAAEQMSAAEQAVLHERTTKVLRDSLMDISGYDIHNPDATPATTTAKTLSRQSSKFASVVQRATDAVKVLLPELRTGS